ncbi:MAG: hypothetical protein ABIA93_07635 [Candidatus Woesearchaeota archaeon]
MTKLLACLAEPVSSWPVVLKLVKCPDFEQIILFCDEKAQKAFKAPENVRVVSFDRMLSAESMRDYFFSILKDMPFEMDVALNLSSGDGKEHMALIAAALRTGSGIRFVTWRKDSMVEV